MEGQFNANLSPEKIGTMADKLNSLWHEVEPDFPVDCCYVVQDQLPWLIVDRLGGSPTEKSAMLQHWRAQMVAAVDEVVERCEARREAPPNKRYVIM